jgi:hypothetical protein
VSLSKPVKEAAPRTEEKGPGKKSNFSLRTKPDELPEIKHNSWLDWDDMMQGLKEFLRATFKIWSPSSQIRYASSILQDISNMSCQS